MMKQRLARILIYIIVSLTFIANFVEWESERSSLSTVSLTLKKADTSSTIKSKNAFVTLLAGIDPYDTLHLDRTSSYLGYLLHLAAVRFVLSETGSQTDVVILMRLVNGTKLPQSQKTYFSKLGLRIELLPPGNKETWESLMMEKFQILRLLEYEQILFFDADVLPLCNWDHYFSLADSTTDGQGGIFGPNLVFAYNNEPAQGGFFLITPQPGDWEAYQKIHFINSSMGFGAPLEEIAEGNRKNYTEWNWHGAAIDQGMLYHWLRYVKRDVTIVIKDRAQRWQMKGNETLVRETRDFNLTCPNHIQLAGEREFCMYPVTRDFAHFTGTKKPWQRVNWSAPVCQDTVERNRFEIWAIALRMAWRNYNLGSIRDLFPNASSTLVRDIEMVEDFLLQNFSEVALCKRTLTNDHSEHQVDPVMPNQVAAGHSRALDKSSSNAANEFAFPRTKRPGHSRNAVFTILAGINPFEFEPLSSRLSYIGYLLHLAAVRYLLDETGVTSDFNILLRVKDGFSSTLPEPQQRFFSKLRINVEYLPQKHEGNWSSTMMEKFNILRYHEYKQVLFVDADVLPLCNWDHFLNMSEGGLFAPNTVFAWQNEPAQGAFFLLSPEPGDWETFKNIPAFINSSSGFGDPLAEPVEGIRHNFTTWSWHGVKDDQGMLFHWVRYVKKKVTLINRDRLQMWQEVNGVVEMVKETLGFNIRCPNSINFTHSSVPDFPLVRDFVHYNGRQKAWQMINWTSPLTAEAAANKDKMDLWASAVRKAWRNYKLGSVRQLIPNISSAHDESVELVERFLRES